ncbi:uncharacterized protein LOC125237351 isoform X2 [Leguminivora glycinivorella]|uniref:uncharacterized protein LOC125237351 isoform X2 n=1 Tax=Leguminivora glycinivorella TaxID=1035111 RepID=UPI00200E823C|nr:uncharacterized protein LOC125237351 isoform X2 [Leguminivora glycinivorella]
MSGKPGKPIRKCEICGVRRWKKSTCDVFLARFPLDPDRCQLWVKLTGNEDLAYLPIERLHGNKFICENHFSRDAFNKKGNRLKRNAIPSRNLNAPLSDEILSSFPIVPEYEKSRKETSLHNFPNPNKFLERFKAWVSIVGGELNTSADYEHYKKKKVCDRHFIDEHRTRSKRLSANAIPTILVPVSNGKKKNDTESAPKTQPAEVHSDHCYSKEISLQVSTPEAPIDLPAEKDDTDSTKLDDYAIETHGHIHSDDHINLDDHIDSYADTFDDDSPSSPVPEIIKTEEVQEHIFSWQGTEPIKADDPAVPVPDKPRLPDDIVTSSLFCDEPKPSLPDLTVPENVKLMCKDCSEAIDGFSFWCVQCLRGALCVACASTDTHYAHFVLRSPKGFTQNPTRAVLAVIRQHLAENLTFVKTDIDGMKEEVKHEPLESLSPIACPDPLAVEPHIDSLIEGPHHDSLTERLDDSLTARLDDSLTERLDDSLTERLDDSLTARLDDSLTERLDDSLTEWLDDSLSESLDDSLTEEPHLASLTERPDLGSKAEEPHVSLAEPRPDPVFAAPSSNTKEKKCVDEETESPVKRIRLMDSTPQIPNVTVKVDRAKLVKVPINILAKIQKIDAVNAANRPVEIFYPSDFKLEDTTQMSQITHSNTVKARKVPFKVDDRSQKVITRTTDGSLATVNSNSIRKKQFVQIPSNMKVQAVTSGDRKVAYSRVAQDVTDKTNMPVRGPQAMMLRSVTSKAAVQLEPLTLSDLQKWIDKRENDGNKHN